MDLEGVDGVTQARVTFPHPGLERWSGNPIYRHGETLRAAGGGRWVEGFAAQVFDARRPGPLVREFDRLLDALRAGPLRISARKRELPPATLEALNAGSLRALKPDVKRLRQSTLPHIDALVHLLHASGLTRYQPRGGKVEVSLDPEALARWDAKDARERYAALLGIWLDRHDVLGEPGEMTTTLVDLLIRIAGSRGLPRYETQTTRASYALLDLAGLGEVTFKPGGGAQSWTVSAAKLTPWGTLVLDWLRALAKGQSDEEARGAADERNLRDTLMLVMSMMYVPLGDGLSRALGVASWSPAPAFPAYRPGVWVWKASMIHHPGVWRRLGVRASVDLDVLSSVVIDAFGFDDHEPLYQFTLRDPEGRVINVSPDEDLGSVTMSELDFLAHELRVGHLPLGPGDVMAFLFDFGDDWRFDLELEAIKPDSALKANERWGVLEEHGEAPAQYEYDDDDFDP